MKKMKYDLINITSNDAEILNVLKHQRNNVDRLVDCQSLNEQTTENLISECDHYLQDLGYPLPVVPSGIKPAALELPVLRSWDEILAEAEKDITTEVSLTDLLTTNEIARAERNLTNLRDAFDAEHRLDGIDWAIAGVAGSLAALVDTFFVKMPSASGLLGGQETKGGALSNYIRERIRGLFTPEQIQVLEQKCGVPYDAVSSADLLQAVSGLNPKTHRFQSLGHDPILGFLFGVQDILHGTMTAIDSSGHLIQQVVAPPAIGMSLFQAIAYQFGHLASDISTPSGLPAPLLPLLQFIQTGSFGKGERTIGDLAKYMYGRGYNFSHFLAMSIPVLTIEVLVRSGYSAKRLMEGHNLEESLPINLPGKPHQPKLQTMLFIAHLISTSVNAGRVLITDNPLAINYPQWIMMAKMSIQQLNWVLLEKEAERLDYVQSKVDQDWDILNKSLSL